MGGIAAVHHQGVPGDPGGSHGVAEKRDGLGDVARLAHSPQRRGAGLRLLHSGQGESLAVAGVRTVPGATEFTLTPLAPSS